MNYIFHAITKLHLAMAPRIDKATKRKRNRSLFDFIVFGAIVCIPSVFVGGIFQLLYRLILKRVAAKLNKYLVKHIRIGQRQAA